MKVINTAIPEVKIIVPNIFKDKRGYFFESFNRDEFNKKTGIELNFVQENQSKSEFGVVRGLHYQLPPAEQGKLVRIIKGKVFDVAVDIRLNSPTFGKWVGEVLSEKNKKQMWIPSGFAHGFVTLSKTSEFLYKTTEKYYPEYERTIKFNDNFLNIDWGISPLKASLKDYNGVKFKNSELFN